MSTKRKEVTKQNTDEQRTPFNLPIPGWNERPMTSRDFAEVCQREGITVKRHRFAGSIRGAHCCLRGRHFIFIDSRLRGLDKLVVEFHELGHYFLHRQKKGLYRRLEDKHCTSAQEWSEVEANLVALTALVPRVSGETFNLFLKTFMQRCIRKNRKGGQR